MKRARIGDLAIARFDPDNGNIRNFYEVVCFVIGTANYSCSRDYRFIYCSGNGIRTEKIEGSLPRSRLVRVKPKKKWDGVLASLTLDDVFVV